MWARICGIICIPASVCRPATIYLAHPHPVTAAATLAAASAGSLAVSHLAEREARIPFLMVMGMFLAGVFTLAIVLVGLAPLQVLSCVDGSVP
jgi:hypothetical protein